LEELLQKHRTFALSVGVGGFVFLLALLLRGCAFYSRDLEGTRTRLTNQAKDLQAPVPDEKHLRELDRLVEMADQRVAALAREVGRTAAGEALWEECIGDVLREIGQDTPQERQALMQRARTLPSAAFSVLVDRARTVFQARASQANVEIAVPDLGFEAIDEASFSRSLAALAVVCRIVGKAVELGVQKIETISVTASAADAPTWLSAQSVFFKVRGSPASLAELVKSVNDRDASGRRLVLDEVRGLGRPETVRPGEPGIAEFNLRVFLVDLGAR
jgi:hypothetical protein